MPRNQEALERRRSNESALARSEMIYPRDVAVRQESTQLALETIHEVEGGLCRLCRVLTVGVHRVDLVHGRHRFVRETAHVAEIARLLDANAAVDLRARQA